MGNKNKEQTKLKWYQNKKVFAGLCAGLGVTTVAAILAPTLVAVSKRSSGGDTPTPTPGSTYTVTFELEGGTISGMSGTSMPIAKGITYGQLPVPTKDNYSFDYWTVDGTEVDPSTVIPGNVTVKAVWTTAPTPTTIHTITFDAGQHGSIQGENVRYAKENALFGSLNVVSVSANSGYLFSGWLLPDGETLIDSSYKITSDLLLTAKYIQRETKVAITFDVSEYAQYGTTVSSAFMNVVSGTKYSELKNSLPIPTNPTIDGNTYIFKYWYYEKDDEGNPIEISSDHPFDSNITLYPYFADESVEIQTVSIEFVTIGNQYLDQRSLAPLTTTVQYCSTEGHEIEHTFGEIAKPTISEPGKVFSKWYKKYDAELGTFSEEWKTTDVLAYTGDTIKVYAECVTPNTNPIITFTSDEDEITWIGNTEVVVDATKIEWSKVSKPYVFKSIQGKPESGFTSPYSLDGWYYKDSQGTHDLKDTDEISKTLTVYPKFSAKPQVVFELDDKTEAEGGPTLSDPVAIDPNNTWGSVVPPGVAVSQTATYTFMGWGIEKTRTVEDPETHEPIEEKYTDPLLPQSSLADITTNTHIKPIFSDACNKLEFYGQAKVNGSSQLQAVRYIGNAVVGTDKDDDVYFNMEVNKPVPQAYKVVSEEKVDIYNFSFSETWQYNETSDPTSENDWHDIDDNYQILKAEGSERHIYIRPVLNPAVHITYKENGGTWKEPTYGLVTDIYTKTDVEFENIYRPTVVPPEGQQFLYWATDPDNPTTTKIDQSTKFTEDTILWAIYDDKEVSSTVYYKLTTEDIAAGATITCDEVTQNHKVNVELKFSQIGKATPKLDGYQVDYWTYDEAGLQVIPDDLVLPNNDSITAYAHFTLDSRYCKISVKQPTSNDDYEIEGTNKVFIENNTAFPVNTTPGAEANLLADGAIAVNVKKPGYEIVGWRKEDEQEPFYHRDTKKTVPILTTSLENIVPVFDVSTRFIEFASLDSDVTVKAGTVPNVPVELNYNTKLKDYIDALGITLEKPSHEFVGWKYTTTSGKTSIIDSTTYLTEDVTITPRFVSESEFKWGTEPYYYDSAQSKWAKIKSFDNPQYLEVYYAGGETANVDKTTFDYQIFFGEDCTAIPDNFMQGCVNWTNKNNAIEIPSRITSIGDNFLHSCTSFNQEIKWETDSQEMTIGDNFMSSCYSFNQNITIKSTFTPSSEYEKPYRFLEFGTGFMFECRSFNKTIDISTFTDINNDVSTEPENWYYTLSSFDKYAAIGRKDLGFTIKVKNEDLYNRINYMLPTLDGSGITPYRIIEITYTE